VVFEFECFFIFVDILILIYLMILFEIERLIFFFIMVEKK